MSMLTDETDAPPADYPSSNRANIIMWLPTGCFLLAMLSLGLVYLYLYLR
jgi:hypothetical protein